VRRDSLSAHPPEIIRETCPDSEVFTALFTKAEVTFDNLIEQLAALL
jgi:hypothetical protein